MMLDPRDWKYEDRLRLLFAAAFGALLGFTNGYSHGWFQFTCGTHRRGRCRRGVLLLSGFSVAQALTRLAQRGRDCVVASQGNIQRQRAPGQRETGHRSLGNEFCLAEHHEAQS